MNWLSRLLSSILVRRKSENNESNIIEMIYILFC